MPSREIPAQVRVHHRRGPQALSFSLQETSGSRHFGMGGGFPRTDRVAERPEGRGFPSTGLRTEIEGLSAFQATASATDFKPILWTPEKIVELSKTKPLRITPTAGIGQREIDKLDRAEALARDVPGAQITILDHEEAAREEKRVQREVNKEFLTNPEAQGIFRRFLTEMVENPDIVSGEYRDFILGHETTGNITSTEDSHSWTNLGLDLDVYDPEGVGLRMGVKGFIKGTLRAPESEELKHRLRYAVTQEGPHPHLSDEESQELIALSFLSHFLRGSVLKGYRGDDLSGSEPRQRGFEMLEEARQNASRQPDAERAEEIGWPSSQIERDIRDLEPSDTSLSDLRKQLPVAEIATKLRALHEQKTGEDRRVKIDISGIDPQGDEIKRIRRIATANGINLDEQNDREKKFDLWRQETKELVTEHPDILDKYMERLLDTETTIASADGTPITQRGGLLVSLWNDDMVNHDNTETNNATDPYDTHHAFNSGLMKSGEEDFVRDHAVEPTLRELIRKYRSRIYQLNGLEMHANDEMNTQDNFERGLGLAVLCELVKARYYDVRGNIQTDPRRQIAVSLFNEPTT